MSGKCKFYFEGNIFMKVGILGAGGIAEKMAYTLGKMETAECAAIASRSIDKARQFADKFGIPKAYSSYEDLANDSSIDLIYIATPHSHHHEHTLLCLEAGRNVLVEKAFAGNKRQAEEMINLARSKNLLIAEAIWTRYMPLHKKLAELIASNAIGKITHLEASLSYAIGDVERMWNPALAGGTLLDLGVYTINFAMMAFGNEIESIDGTATLTDTGVDEAEDFRITFKDGHYALLQNKMTEQGENTGKIYGENGYVLFDNVNCGTKIEIYTNDGKVTKIETPPLITGFEYQVEACRKAISEGKGECVDMPHSEILLVMEFMDKLRKKWGVRYPFD